MPVPKDKELMYSSTQAHLSGRVRSVLTVEVSDAGGYVRTSSIIAKTYDVRGAAVDSSYNEANIEFHSRTLGRLGYSTVYLYDKKGRLVVIREYSPDGTLAYKRLLNYNVQGRPNQWSHYAGESKLIATEVYLYDHEKRTTTVSRDKSKTVFFYNEKGWWTKRMVYLADGSIEDHTTFEHDDKGNVTKETKYDKQGNYLYANLFTYKFDKFGNWIEKETTYTQLGDDQIPRSRTVMYRMITYFTGR